MYAHHLVQFGALGQIGRFSALDGTRYRQRTRVVCRTRRGLELGKILSPVTNDRASVDGDVLRAVTVQDDLLLARLDRYRQSAFEACEALLSERKIPAVLMDVEQLFDGQSLYFYFLGEVTPELERLTHELAEVYESRVQFRRFTAALTEGCGPDCGSENKDGCGSSGCASCAIAQACGTHRHG